MPQDFSSWLLIATLFACLGGALAWLILDRGYQRRLAHLQQRVSQKLQEQGQTYSTLTAQVANLRGRLTDFDAERRKLVGSNQQLAAELEQRTAELRATAADARAHKDELTRTQVQRNELSARGAERDSSRVKALQGELAVKSHELAATIERNADAEARAQRELAELRELATRSSEVESRLAARATELEASLERQAAELRERESACTALRGELGDGAQQIDTLGRRCEELEQQLQRQTAQALGGLDRTQEFESALALRDEELRSRATELDSARGELAEKSVQLEALAQRCGALEHALDARTSELEVQLTQRDEALRRNASAMDSLERELTLERDQLESVEQRYAQLERQLVEQGEQLQAQRSRAEQLERTLAARTGELEGQVAQRDEELRQRSTALESVRGELADEHWRCGDLDVQIRQQSERSEGFERRVRELEQALSTRTGELDGQLTQRDEELRQRATALELVRSELADKSWRCGELDAQIRQQSERAEGFERRVRELEQALSTRTGELDGQLTQRDEELRQRATALESVRSELADKSWRCGELDAQVRQQSERAEGFERRVRELEQALSTRTGELEGQLTQRDEELRQRSTALESVRNELADKAWRCGELEEQLARRDEELRQRAAAAESLNGALADKNRELHALDQRCAELEHTTSAHVGELDTSLATRENELQQLRAEHARLAERCEALARNVDAGGSELLDREREIADADARIDALKREVEQRRDEFRADSASIDELVESRICPLFRRQDSESLPTAYLEGVAEHDFERALRGLLGDTTPLSAESMTRLGVRWRDEHQAWKKRPSQSEVVYLWADGVHVRAGLTPENSSLLVLVAGLVDGTKCITAIESGQREAPDAWLAILRDLHSRGMNVPRAIVADGALGIWPALDELGWACARQTCWAYEIERIVAELPKRQQRLAGELLRDLSNADTRASASRMKEDFVKRYRKRRPQAGERLQAEWERLSSFYAFPKDHWPHLRTTHVVESPFATMRLRTSAPKPCAPTANAEALLWKLLVVGERTFRKLNSPQLLPAVAAGAHFVDGVQRDRSRARAA